MATITLGGGLVVARFWSYEPSNNSALQVRVVQPQATDLGVAVYPNTKRVPLGQWPVGTEWVFEVDTENGTTVSTLNDGMVDVSFHPTPPPPGPSGADLPSYEYPADVGEIDGPSWRVGFEHTIGQFDLNDTYLYLWVARRTRRPVIGRVGFR